MSRREAQAKTYSSQSQQYKTEEEETAIPTTADPRKDNGLREFWAEYNTKSIDGLPGMVIGLDSLSAPASYWTKEGELKRSEEKVLRVWGEKKAEIRKEQGTRVPLLFSRGRDGDISHLKFDFDFAFAFLLGVVCALAGIVIYKSVGHAGSSTSRLFSYFDVL